MRRFKVSKSPGTAPGSLVYTGDEKGEVKIECIEFNTDSYQNSFLNINEIKNKKVSGITKWINITGVHNIDMIKSIGEEFSIDTLVMEDIVNINQRAKIEVFDDYLFVVLKMLTYNKTEHIVEEEQVAFILKDGILLSFQEREGDVFNPIRERIKRKSGKIRSRGSDYLFYSLFDTILDNYVLILENLLSWIETLDEEIEEKISRDTPKKIYNLKKELLKIRRAAFPLRDIIMLIYRGEAQFIKKATVKYFRDINDHIMQITDNIDFARDSLSDLQIVYHQTVNFKMDETMKVLTMIATIFIPLSFIAGIYGMNFEYMPELEVKYAYFLVLGIMFTVLISMLYFFRKKEWI